ncbi:MULTISPECIES: antirestriction protein ArdA [unclassified Clostridioides]|uniref:antirestriction protein ArdA n=1 Tax=unclassified Clostridioides TaxID=2635829 RepID=UPI001D0C9DE6|nr:antirestriction protein ArdA [Clostridioides sp. ES-S-0049-03]MCC0764785.1 antirestriction protein ArdA [Clostridioides sp. ES-S-0006-03]
MLNIYITNLGKYNEGELIGEWAKLPVNEEELQEILNRIGINEEYEEYSITDFETDMKGLEIEEYSNIKQLNQLAEKIEELDIAEFGQLEALLEGDYIDIDTILENDISNLLEKHDFTLLDGENPSKEIELAYNSIENLGGIDNLDIETLKKYFNYKEYGECLITNGAYIASNSIAVIN